ncbi:MAG: hypothetical protein JNL90_19320 [Planctomycetes bacterium]|nr:hypothetical protein [Planctomycetota bacterium]
MTPIHHVLATTLAGRIYCHQQRVLEYLLEEYRILKSEFRRRRHLLTHGDCLRLSVRCVVLVRRPRHDVTSIVTPDGLTGLTYSLRAYSVGFDGKLAQSTDVELTFQ